MSVRSELSKFWRILTDPAYRAFRRDYKNFRRAHGKGTPGAYTGLLTGQTVLDVGGFHGEWAEMMRRRYAVRVEVFELHPSFAKDLKARFAGQEDVVIHPYAIGHADGEMALSDDGDASSALVGDGPSVTGQVRAVGPVFEEHGLDHVAVMKVNIEGGEYDLLPALIEDGLIDRIDRITVQFHKFTEDDRARRDEIREALSRTHDCVWCYPFIWEEWHKKGLGV